MAVGMRRRVCMIDMVSDMLIGGFRYLIPDI